MFNSSSSRSRKCFEPHNSLDKVLHKVLCETQLHLMKFTVHSIFELQQILDRVFGLICMSIVYPCLM